MDNTEGSLTEEQKDIVIGCILGDGAMRKKTHAPLVMAVWCMDDGSKSRNAVYLNTQQFSQEEQQYLCNMLFAQWSIHATLNKDKIYTRIRISVASVPLFSSLVKPYMQKELLYKLPQ